uniref:Uncharacterized protein n=1 Tax=Candidatus Kentrum sp. FW TaxID=2126338 RepID=A0A450SP83_9GAMM|nr:MAG: protein of unknown function (DUF4102) [Candidatus Kentron sp. FW]
MLTDRQIKNLKHCEKVYRKCDAENLYIEVPPHGKKRWRFKYRHDNKAKMLSLGVYPLVSLSDARKRRDEARRLLASGIDPSENRKVQKAAQTERFANSFEVVAREWFAKHSPRWAKSHSDRVIRRLELEAFPWIGERPIDDITPSELRAVVERIEKRGALETVLVSPIQ